MSYPDRDLITIDLAAVRSNVRSLLARLTPGTRLTAIVKADGYGHGGVEVAQAAVEAGAHALGVATVEEAVELRDAGYRGSLLVMGPLFTTEEVEELARLDVEVTVVTSEMFNLIRKMRPAPSGLNLHLKVDTGMNRQGVQPAEAEGIMEEMDRLPGVTLTGLMTHFACADEDAHCVAAQLAAFRTLLGKAKSGRPALVAHAANSAAALRNPDTHLDMVRCGIAVYGLSPFQDDARQIGLAPALSWTSTVATVKPIRAEEGCGYGHTFRAARDGWLALVPLGYADGVRRDRGNRGAVLIGGRRYPIVGRVSMDSFSVDLGPDASVTPGDRVTLIGADGEEKISVEEVARELGTINYEVTCSIVVRRAHRVFAN